MSFRGHLSIHTIYLGEVAKKPSTIVGGSSGCRACSEHCPEHPYHLSRRSGQKIVNHRRGPPSLRGAPSSGVLANLPGAYARLPRVADVAGYSWKMIEKAAASRKHQNLLREQYSKSQQVNRKHQNQLHPGIVYSESSLVFCVTLTEPTVGLLTQYVTCEDKAMKVLGMVFRMYDALEEKVTGKACHLLTVERLD